MADARFFFGAMSPYSWFAAERIGTLIPTAVWQPVFAGGLFQSVGRRSWGVGAGRADGIADCEQRASEHGLGPMRWPARWPTSDVLIARALLVAEREQALERFALAAMREQFRSGAELGDPATVAAIATGVGLDGAVVVTTAGTTEIKQELRRRTDGAVALGVFGVPTVLTAGGERYWGDDRLDEAARAIADGR